MGVHYVVRNGLGDELGSIFGTDDETSPMDWLANGDLFASRTKAERLAAEHGGTVPFQPWRLTMALDASMLYDPELSESLGVEVGVVDEWEEGITSPTTKQVNAICRLTGYAPKFFFSTEPPVDMESCSLRYHVDGWQPEEHMRIDGGRWITLRDRPDLPTAKREAAYRERISRLEATLARERMLRDSIEAAGT